MASSNPLDQLVKGAPSPNTTLSSVAAAAASPSAPSHALAAQIHESKKPSLNLAPTSEDDPVSLLPSSPPQIYLNLLILEASLRSQYLTLRARRRQHTFFLALLAGWNLYFLYALFLRPREDGKGMGGSVYWVVDMGEKVAFMGGLLTVLLIWGTGQLERGVRWPRRWVGVTNRGLRGMNLKIVILRGSWWARFVEMLSVLFPYASIFGRAQGSEFRVVEFPPEKRPASSGSGNGIDTNRHIQRVREEDVAPGGDAVKLLLLPKQFSPEFRDNWELYRTEYWERENERRAGLRKIVRARERELAKSQGGWLWWAGWRGWSAKKSADLEKVAHAHHIHHAHGSSRVPKDSRKKGPGGLQAESHSRSSSRSSTATPDIDEQRAASRGHRRYKSSHLSTSTSSSTASSKQPRPSTRLALTPVDSVEEASTHDQDSSKVTSQKTLHKRASTVSNASSSSAYDSEISERSTTSTTGMGIGVGRTRQRDLPMSGLEGDD